MEWDAAESATGVAGRWPVYHDELERSFPAIEAELTNRDFEHGFTDKRFWPDGVEKFLFGDELAWTPEEIAQHCEGFGSELNCLCASPQALVGQVQVKGIEDYTFFTSHFNYQRYRSFTASL